MTENSEIFKEDMRWICEADLPWEKLDKVEDLKNAIKEKRYRESGQSPREPGERPGTPSFDGNNGGTSSAP